MKNQNVTWKLVFTTLILILSSFQFGYGIGELNSAEFFIPYFTHGKKVENTVIFTHENRNKTCHNMNNFFKDCVPMKSSTEWSLCVSLFCIGGLIGAFLGGPLSSCCGRKWALWTTTLVFGIDYILKSLFSSFWTLMFGRILHGVAAGTATAIVPMFLTEITPQRVRGMFGVFHQVGVVVGLFFCQLISIFVYRDGQYWRILMGWPILLSLVQFVFLPLYCPESPKYLVSKNKEEKARKILMELRGVKKKDKYGVEEELDSLKRESNKDQEGVEEENKFHFGWCRFFYHLMLACALQVIQQFSGTNAISFYSTKVYSVIFPNERLLPTILSAVTMGFTIFAVLPTTILVEILGRKCLLLGGTLMEILTMLGVTVFQVVMVYGFSKGGAGRTVFGVLTIICVILFRMFFQWSLGPIPWFMISEMFPTNVRGYGNAAAVATNWLCTFIVGQFFTPLQEALDMFCFLIFTVFMVFAWFFMFFCLMETKGKTIEEVSSSTFLDNIFFCDRPSCWKKKKREGDDGDGKKFRSDLKKATYADVSEKVYDVVNAEKKVLLPGSNNNTSHGVDACVEDEEEGVDGEHQDGTGEYLASSEVNVNNVVDYNINLSDK